MSEPLIEEQKEATPVPDGRVTATWIKLIEVLDAGEAWVDDIPTWVPIVPEFSRYFLKGLRAESTLLFRRDPENPEAEKLRAREALGKSARIAGEALGHGFKGALEGLGVYFILRTVTGKRPGSSENGSGPTPTPGPDDNPLTPEATAAAQSREPEELATSDEGVPLGQRAKDQVRQVAAYLDEKMGTTDEKILLSLLPALEFFVDLLPSGKSKSRALAIIKAAKLALRGKKVVQTAAQALRNGMGNEPVDTQQTAEAAVESAEEVLKHTQSSEEAPPS